MSFFSELTDILAESAANYLFSQVNEYVHSSRERENAAACGAGFIFANWFLNDKTEAYKKRKTYGLRYQSSSLEAAVNKNYLNYSFNIVGVSKISGKVDVGNTGGRLLRGLFNMYYKSINSN